MRIGFGYDVHRLEEGYDLVLGGMHIPHEKGSVAHSDGDVLIHAICDALLGAANMGDIGSHFPDTDPAYKNIPSTRLLQTTMQLLNDEGYRPINIDSTICLQRPKLSSYIEKMKAHLSGLLGTSAVSVKATTTERLGFVGREEGIAAYAVALIEQRA
ncbi:MAG: 2-C-methyl-D-erythritol 2,4-cyclodiphosphate synthase [Bacteroidales bacterium]